MIKLSKISIKKLAIASFAIAILSLTSLYSQETNAFSGTGTGSVSDPYLISDCEDLQSINDDLEDYGTSGMIYRLNNDIDCSATSGWNSGEGFIPIGSGGYSFEGAFDGAGHTIDNLYINRPNQDYVALFAQTAYDSTIGRFNLANVDITGRSNVGAIAGEGRSLFKGIAISGSVTGANPSMNEGVGGAIGKLRNTDIASSSLSFSGTVNNTGFSTGGLVGEASNGMVVDSYVDADITGGNYTGGLFGRATSCCTELERSYATGTVNGDVYVGGLVGSLTSAGGATINNVFNTAQITGVDANGGGIIGTIEYNYNYINFTNAYYDQTATGLSQCYAISSVSAGCTAVNTDGEDSDYFFNSSNAPLSAWDFTNVWQSNGSSLPTLRQVSAFSGPSEINNPVAVEGDSLEEVSLNWDDPDTLGSFDLEHYLVQGKKQSDAWSGEPEFQDSVGSWANNEISFDDIEPDTSYVFRIRTVTRFGSSDWVEVNFTSASAASHNISSCEDLQGLSDAGSRLDDITLTADIDCSGIENFQPLDWDREYTGTFDGQNHTISNLTINRPEDSLQGLFREMDGAVFKNVTFSGGSVEGYYEVGAIAGEAYNTTVENVTSDLDITAVNGDGYYVGGLFGSYTLDEESVLFKNIAVTGDITSDYGYMGGLIGSLNIYGYDDEDVELKIEESFYEGEVKSTYEGGGGAYVGGFIGYTYIQNDDDGYAPARLSVLNSYSRGSVDAGNGTGSSAGGLFGYLELYNDGADSMVELNIEKAYSSSAVSGSEDVAGMVGELYSQYEGESTNISDSFVAGSIQSSEGEGSSYAVIGNEGYVDGGASFSSSNVYFDLTRTGQINRGYTDGIENGFGINGSNSQPGYFQNNTTNPPLNTWNFEDIWSTDPEINDGYPYLQASGGTPTESSVSETIYPEGDGTKAILVEQIGESEVCSALDNMFTRKESDLEAQDQDYNYLSHIIGFTLTGCEEGGTTTVRLVFKGGYNPTSTVVRKYSSTTHEYQTIDSATKAVTTLEGQPALEVTYQITDGGELDQDGEANGTIIDPVGLAQLDSSNSSLAGTGQSGVLYIVIAGAAVSFALLMLLVRKRAPASVAKK